MTNQKKKEEKKEILDTPAREPQIPISSVPHLFNEQMLIWQKAQFNALKAIYEELVKLTTILSKE